MMIDNIDVENTAESQFYSIAARSDIGNRDQQQDHACLYLSQNQVFAAVCDGMGGMPDGDIASKEAVQAVKSSYLTNPPGMENSIPGMLIDAMRAADKAVASRTHGMGGSTLVSIFISAMQLFWISVGDSRLYIVRDGKIVQATRDHNYRLRLDEMLQARKIGLAEYEKENCRGDALLSYLGKGDVNLYDLTRTAFPLQHGDSIFLTTDGVFRAINSLRLCEILSSEYSASKKADTIIQLVREKAAAQAQDNSTFVLIDVL